MSDRRRSTLPKRRDEPIREQQPESIPLPAVKRSGGALALPDLRHLESELEHVPPQLNRGDSRKAKDRRVYRR